MLKTRNTKDELVVILSAKLSLATRIKIEADEETTCLLNLVARQRNHPQYHLLLN